MNLDAWRATPEQAVFYSIPETYLEELDDDEIYLDDEDLEMPLAVQGLEPARLDAGRGCAIHR